MRDPDNTSVRTLMRAAEIGYQEGLHYVYAGNIPGQLGNLEDTRCPHCQTTLVRRRGFYVFDNKLTNDGCCPNCQSAIPGIWKRASQARHS